ncbi:uncharacterized protein N7498_001703 [Penicillium cinerascens]|uniref:Uncharacterized protein n=1 Tax=Penicillium cinerascens TaxID=70096 RepID=A0A9W9N8U2_9EURO|nr:uncharacterized protein N7498_001703 [Penicillium cinerascens]KAJ5215296.1 hypothetical protein N7498_001703 [Penicillium cinerascens]
MDNPDHEHKSVAAPIQDPSCPALEHGEQCSIQTEEELPELILPQSSQSQTLHDPSQPLVEELKCLDQDSLHLSQPAAQMLRFYSMLWESYSAKKAHSQRLEKENEALRAININLCQERESLEYRHANQEALLVYFEDAFENVRRGILGVLKDWENCSPELVPERDSTHSNGGDPQLA